MFSYIKIHSINHKYEFMDKLGKIREGKITEVDIRKTKYMECIIYVVEFNGEFFNVDHETNRVL